MANTQPRRNLRKPVTHTPTKAELAEAPWNIGNSEKKVAINVPFPEPLMLQLDYLVMHRAISSKSSFIRDVVQAAAEREIDRLRRVQKAVLMIEAEDRAKK